MSRILSVAVVWRCSLEKMFLKISFLIKVQVATLSKKKRLWQRFYPVNFVEFLRIPFYSCMFWGKRYDAICSESILPETIVFTDESKQFQSHHWRCSIKNASLKNFAIFTRKHLRWSLFKKRIQHRCFPVNIAKFLRTPSLENMCERLFLDFF